MAPPQNSRPAPPPRSAGSALASALWVLLFAAAVGAVVALWTVWGELQAQRYAPMGFTRSTWILVREAADQGVLAGLSIGAPWALALCAAFAVLGRSGQGWSAARLLAIHRDRIRFRVAQILCAAVFALSGWMVGLAGLELSRAETYLLGIFTVLACLALEPVAWYARLARRTHDHVVAANVLAASAAVIFLFVLGFQAERSRMYRPTDLATLRVNAAVLGAGALLFVWLRWNLLARHVVRPATGSLERTRAAMAAVVLLAVASPAMARALLASRGAPTLQATRPWNVVVIGIDTWRADHATLTAPAAGQRDLTPNMRRIASRGVVFSHAISQSPWTMPAFASIMTGKYPLQHGAVSLTGKVRPRETLLGEVLREAGYSTGAFVSHDFVDEVHGFQQGCDEFDDTSALGRRAVTSAMIADHAVEFLDRQGEAPFYLFTHFFDPHYEYREHADWDFADGYDGWFVDMQTHDNLVKLRHLVGPEELKYVRDLYDEEIAYTDREIGRMFDAIERRGLLDQTIFVFVGDHGEEFMEHGNPGHVLSLYDELLRVPLVAVVPGAADAGTVDSRVVETRQVFSTVIVALGIDYGHQSRPPSLLAPRAEPVAPSEGEPAPAREPRVAFSMVWLPDADPNWGQRFRFVSLRTDRWKLIRDLTREKLFLFDLEADPGEQNNLAESQPERLAGLLHELDAWLERVQQGPTDIPQAQMDGDSTDRLKNLGYM